MSQPYTLAGSKVGICVTPQNSDLTGESPGFAGLAYVNIANVGQFGPYGYTSSEQTYPVLDRAINLKLKGSTDGGSCQIQFADTAGDAGQIAMRAAANPLISDNYAFRVELSNGAIHYLRGPLSGPNNPGGNNDAIAIKEYTLLVNEILEVDPPTSP